MTVRVLDGFRVVDVSQFGFVPSAAAVLSDWGADVIKVEHPVHGDPMRGVSTSYAGGGARGVYYEIANRGKRDVGIDIAHPDGRDLLERLVGTCDVFMTSFLPDARQRLGIDVADIQAINPRAVYGRGSGQGVRGPEAEKGGFDVASFWARGGIAAMTTTSGAALPCDMPSGAFGDFTSGMALAGGIAAALLHRERTGEAMVVDVSLLSVAMWAMAASITGSRPYGTPDSPQQAPAVTPVGPRRLVANPVSTTYRTRDGRFVRLQLLQSDRHWPELCRIVGRPDLEADPRFADAASREANNRACTEALEALFAERDLAEWRQVLAPMEGVWAAVQTPDELLRDPQALANGYVQEVDRTWGGEPLSLVASPVQFDERAEALTGAPDFAEHTDEVLLDLGLTWDDLLRLKADGAIY